MSGVPGTRIGAYDILAKLGEGGMGAVYRARDTKLNRDVALKVLLPAVANDPERLARFSREAQVLASLNHPHIAGIYGLEDGGATKALVMELVEGEDLSQRIARGAIPLDEALPIARQIAEALEAAHEQGIVHRDLKPANIKVRPDGTVKVLDFGLAKAMEAPGSGLQASGPAVTQSPTITTPAMPFDWRSGHPEQGRGVTQAGMILGTAAYMSPEQAKGKPVDKRADIWAFGAVLYEMLTGRRAFEGEGITDTLANVLKTTPDWALLPDETPAAVRLLVRRCLEKDPAARVRDIASAGYVLETAPVDFGAQRHSPPPSQTGVAITRRLWQVGGLAALIGAAASAAAVVGLTPARPGVAAEPPVRLELGVPMEFPFDHGAVDSNLAVAPDGSFITWTGSNGLVIRALVSAEMKLLVTVAASPGRSAPAVASAVRSPFVSPDSRWIGFATDTEIYKVAISGGAPILLCRVDSSLRGATWLDDGTIVYATADATTGLWRVPASGGEPAVLTRPSAEPGDVDHVRPWAVPGGKLLFTRLGRDGGAPHVSVLDLASGESRDLVAEAMSAQYLAPGHLLYADARSSMLRAIRYDVTDGTVSGDPVSLPDQVSRGMFGAARFALSPTGLLAYPVTSGRESRMVRVTRDGREEPWGPAREYGGTGAVRVSPNGQSVVSQVHVAGGPGVVYAGDPNRGPFSPLVTSGAALYPQWSADGRQVIYAAEDGAQINLFMRPADGSGTPQRLLPPAAAARLPLSMTSDGRELFVSVDNADIYVLSMETKALRPVIVTPFREHVGAISPDGTLLAYTSEESGRREVYVAPYPEASSRRWRISRNGGNVPRWTRGGRELVYLDGSGGVASVAVAGGAEPRFAEAVGLFHWSGDARTFDVSPDGSVFYLFRQAASPGATTFTIVTHLLGELERRAPPAVVR